MQEIPGVKDDLNYCRNVVLLPARPQTRRLSESGFLKKNTGIFGESAGIFMYILVLNSQKRYQYFLSSFKTSDD